MRGFKVLFSFLVWFFSFYVYSSDVCEDCKVKACYLMCEYESLTEVDNDTDVKFSLQNNDFLQHFVFDDKFSERFLINQKIFSSKPFKPPRV